ncbi:hypothetical protein Taro_047899 [Colocasia esculenta]|uniref:Uncharacterized protein n=1 Tax=Colocasia esculenta TaxID=4460 RepID=A0A843WU83_COLES|nr:hypothetical protein [Colocasia esculenta]
MLEHWPGQHVSTARTWLSTCDGFQNQFSGLGQYLLTGGHSLPSFDAAAALVSTGGLLPVFPLMERESGSSVNLGGAPSSSERTPHRLDMLVI